MQLQLDELISTDSETISTPAVAWLMNYQRSAGGAGWDTVQLAQFGSDEKLHLTGYPPLPFALAAATMPCEVCGTAAPPARRC